MAPGNNCEFWLGGRQSISEEDDVTKRAQLIPRINPAQASKIVCGITFLFLNHCGTVASKPCFNVHG